MNADKLKHRMPSEAEWLAILDAAGPMYEPAESLPLHIECSRKMAARLQECVQGRKLGLGGENVADLVIAAYEKSLSEIHMLREANESIVRQEQASRNEANRLRGRVAGFTDALKFYADSKNWTAPNQMDADLTPTTHDGGRRARVVLGQAFGNKAVSLPPQSMTTALTSPPCPRCVLCSELATTTAAGIPVCAAHDAEYQEEGAKYLPWSERVFYQRLLEAYTAREDARPTT